MGLFGSKDECPICGQPVKGLLNVKIKDKVKICSGCSQKISMDVSMYQFQTVENIKNHLLYREENRKMYEHFSPTNEAKCTNGFFREDSNMKKWYFSYVKNPENPALFDYNEIVDYEILEDGDQIAKGGLGAAVAGGILLGGVGAVVGSNTGKKRTKTEISSMKLRLSLNNPYHTQIIVDFIPAAGKVKSGSMTYNMYKQQANTVMSFLDNICSKAQVSDMSSQQLAAPSDADELLKFKNLLDQGVITQEEFDAKKKQILGL